MLIRSAQLEDLDAVFVHARALASSFDVEYEAFKISFLHHLDCDSSLLLVSLINEQIVGYCLGYDHYAFYANGKISWLEEIYVIDEFRKNNIGRELMNSFELWAKSRNSKLIALATRRASSFYRAIGYEESAVYFRKIL